MWAQGRRCLERVVRRLQPPKTEREQLRKPRLIRTEVGNRRSRAGCTASGSVINRGLSEGAAGAHDHPKCKQREVSYNCICGTYPCVVQAHWLTPQVVTQVATRVCTRVSTRGFGKCRCVAPSRPRAYCRSSCNKPAKMAVSARRSGVGLALG